MRIPIFIVTIMIASAVRGLGCGGSPQFPRKTTSPQKVSAKTAKGKPHQAKAIPAGAAGCIVLPAQIRVAAIPVTPLPPELLTFKTSIPIPGSQQQ
jgi:hypothetical protein